MGDRIGPDSGSPTVLYVLDPFDPLDAVSYSGGVADNFTFAVTDDPTGEQR